MIGIISLAVKSTIIIAGAFAVAALARRTRASVRHGVFAACFITLLVLPLAPRLVPSTPVAVQVPIAVSVAAGPPAEVASAGQVAPAGEGALGGGSSRSIEWLVVARNVYLAGAALLLASLGAGVWRLRRWAGSGEIWSEGTNTAADVARENGIRRAVLVVLTDEVAVPLTFGFRRQTIVMPATAARWPAGAVRRAIRHELEHVRRDDWTMQLLARIACALYWPHPMVWMALRRFCLEAERACDDAVVQSSDASIYAEQLVGLARALERNAAVPALAMASRSRLSERVHAILDPRQRRGPQTRATLLLTVSLVVAVLVSAGSVQVVAAAASLSDSTSDVDVEDGVSESVADDLDDFGFYREAIIRAAEKGDIRALELFAGRGVDLNAPIIGDGTPLLIASRAGRKEAVRWLLDRGVDPNVPSPGDGNALIAAAGSGQTDIMQLLLDRGARIEDVVPGDESALITAAAEGSDQAVKLLIARGANVNARVWADDREWRTPLNMARRNGHRDIVRILLGAGARE
ncbi:MAG TPA: ankyrin repeat domain-containing protein [Thermoanaerobaculia bacterium]|nr:ankyrin repeat domain-containing protein [Thermoanaerobaculia bacterium]